MSRGFTLIETAVSVAVFSIVVVATLGLIQSVGDTSSTVYSSTSAQLEAERVLRLVRDELRLTGVAGGYTFDPQPVGAEWEMTYRRLDPVGDIFNEVDPDPSDTAPWSNQVFSLRFEREPMEADDGVDNDGDHLVDEGQVVLRDANTGAVVAILGKNISSFAVDYTPANGTVVRDRLHLTVTVERVLTPAVTSEDYGTLASGGGPRVRHTADLHVVLPN